jgi:hypothetical protein
MALQVEDVVVANFVPVPVLPVTVAIELLGWPPVPSRLPLLLCAMKLHELAEKSKRLRLHFHPLLANSRRMDFVKAVLDGRGSGNRAGCLPMMIERSRLMRTSDSASGVQREWEEELLVSGRLAKGPVRAMDPLLNPTMLLRTFCGGLTALSTMRMGLT